MPTHFHFTTDSRGIDITKMPAAQTTPDILHLMQSQRGSLVSEDVTVTMIPKFEGVTEVIANVPFHVRATIPVRFKNYAVRLVWQDVHTNGRPRRKGNLAACTMLPETTPTTLNDAGEEVFVYNFENVVITYPSVHNIVIAVIIKHSLYGSITSAMGINYYTVGSLQSFHCCCCQIKCDNDSSSTKLSLRRESLPHATIAYNPTSNPMYVTCNRCMRQWMYLLRQHVEVDDKHLIWSIFGVVSKEQKKTTQSVIKSRYIQSPVEEPPAEEPPLCSTNDIICSELSLDDFVSPELTFDEVLLDDMLHGTARTDVLNYLAEVL
jgi:hypothetical protein